MKKTYTTKEKYVTLGIAFLCAITLFACANNQDNQTKGQQPSKPKTEQSANKTASSSQTKKPTSTSSQTSTGTWGYSGAKGPSNWSNLSKAFAACKTGSSQSPIDISDTQAKTGAKKDQVNWQFRPILMTLQKQGELLQAVPTPIAGQKRDSVNQIKVGDTVYSLQAVQFHMSSEHTIQGKSFPMEMEWLYQDKTGKRINLSVFAKEGKENPTINRLVSALSKVPDKHPQPIQQAVSVLGLFPFQSPTYDEYDGSLTTPPCTENVKWVVYNQPIEMSKQQLQAFQTQIANTNRPIQSNKGRTITTQKSMLTP